MSIKNGLKSLDYSNVKLASHKSKAPQNQKFTHFSVALKSISTKLSMNNKKS